MSKKPKTPLVDRVTRAAEAALAAQHYVSPIDVLVGIGWLMPTQLESWRRGQVAYLERVTQGNLSKVSDAMHLFRSWAIRKGLKPSETAYVVRKSSRQPLRFSRSGDHRIEAAYRTHWVSPELSEKKRARLAEKVSRPPELVAIQPHNQDWKCHRCGGTGGLLMMQDDNPTCLTCVDLGDLTYLPAGDALLSRRAKAKSARFAVVVRFSRTRERYERIGLLVEPQALAEAERSLTTD